jgi:hypothetical protein
LSTAIYPALPKHDAAHIAAVAHIAGSAVPRSQAAKSELKRELQARQRVWLEEIIKATGKSASQIAEASGVSDTTLTRLLNNPDYEGTLSQLTIDRVKETFSVPGPEEYAGGTGRRPKVLSFSEAERVAISGGATPLERVLKELTAGRNGADAWRLKTDALAAAGYLPGDVLIVDLNQVAAPQDAVCAQVHDWKGGGAETVWRVFTPPFLVGAALDRTAYKPLLVDNDRVIIKGVVVAMFRPHTLSAMR